MGDDVEPVEQIRHRFESEVIGLGIELDKDVPFAVAAQPFEQQLGENNMAAIGILEHHLLSESIALGVPCEKPRLKNRRHLDGMY